MIYQNQSGQGSAFKSMALKHFLLRRFQAREGAIKVAKCDLKWRGICSIHKNDPVNLLSLYIIIQTKSSQGGFSFFNLLICNSIFKGSLDAYV